MPSEPENPLGNLIALLQKAHAGELAAAYAYCGHSNSLRDPDERRQVRKIEDEEWHHRHQVAEMLAQLGSHPQPVRELRASLVGRTLSFLCRFSGWFLPMYMAGKLERRNIREYEEAARYARGSGREEFLPCLLAMAEVEWEHEQYFRSKVLGHPWAQHLRLWEPPPPKETIRDPDSVRGT